MCKLCNYYKTNYSNYKYCPECGKYIHNGTPKFFNNNIPKRYSVLEFINDNKKSKL